MRALAVLLLSTTAALAQQLPPGTALGNFGTLPAPPYPVPTTGSGAIVRSNNGTFDSRAYFKSGFPWCDVRAMGAVGDGHTDDSDAIQACVDLTVGTVASTIVYFPPANASYCAKKGIVTRGLQNPITFLGINEGGSSVSACGADVTVFKIGSSLSKIVELTVYGKGYPSTGTADAAAETFGATKPAIHIDKGCVNCMLYRVAARGGSNAILFQGGDSKIYFSEASHGYGSAAVLTRGDPSDSSNGIASGTFFRNAFDQNWPVQLLSQPYTVSGWVAGRTYAKGDTVSTQGYYIQATNAGTAAATGTGPVLKNYGVDIVDGTIVWRLVSASQYFLLQIDSSTYELSVGEQDLSGVGTAGMALTNTLSSPRPPGWITINGAVAGQQELGGVYASHGDHVFIRGSRFGAGYHPTQSAGAIFSNSFSGQVIATDNIIFRGGLRGFDISAGNDYIISNNHIAGNGGEAVRISGGVNRFVISNNLCLPGSTDCIIVTGASDRYSIIGNVDGGISGAVVRDQGTGGNKAILGNVGTLASTTRVAPAKGTKK